ncbi:hypothetical protein D3C78_1342690 [compost metagenome]
MTQFTDVREGFIERMTGEIIVLEIAAKVVECVFDTDQAGGFPILTLHVFIVVTDNHADALKNPQVIRFTALLNQLFFNVLIKRLCLLLALMVGENGVGMFGCQLLAVLRGTGLEQDRPPLWRATNIQRPLHREELALVIQGMQFTGAEKFTAVLVSHKSVAFPRVP